MHDFCKQFDPFYTRHLLQSGHRHRTLPAALGDFRERLYCDRVRLLS
jgi:hypothetical protein